MTDALQVKGYATDASQAGYHPNYFQLQHQLRSLIDRHLSGEHFHDRLQDLPIQFSNPQPRPWQTIDWQAIERQQTSASRRK